MSIYFNNKSLKFVIEKAVKQVFNVYPNFTT
jgi:hypothetical protein